MKAPVLTQSIDGLFIVTINRPECRNAVNKETAQALYNAFKLFDRDDSLTVAILTGAGQSFCAGADLKAIGTKENRNHVSSETELGPMGPTRLKLSKPVIAAVEGHAVAGGLELALWCDLRVASESAVFGVFCRRFGVPLVDLGTVRLPRLIGQSRAMDMILTGRGVKAEEALDFGLANRICAEGQALHESVQLAKLISKFPQNCLRNDRLSALEQWSLPESAAWQNEFQRGLHTLQSGETEDGSSEFSAGKGRKGSFDD